MTCRNHLDNINESKPYADSTAIARSRQAIEQLAAVGIEIGGYRLEPALGRLLKLTQPSRRASQQLTSG